LEQHYSMKNNLMRGLSLAFLSIFILVTRVDAQLDCNQGYIYYLTGSSIMTLDPGAALVPGVNPVTNAIPQMGGSEGLAVGDNINGGALSPTFYTVSGSQYWYWDGATWVNTGHSSGPAAAVNIGAGGGYIYNLIGFSGEVWRYDGTGPAILVTTVTTFNGGGPYDITCDCEGNFYLLNTSNPNQSLTKYDPNGVVLQTWTLTGAPSNSAGGGFGIIGNMVYYNNTSGYLGGPMVGTQVNFSTISGAGLSPQPTDFGSCPVGGLSVGGANTPVQYCPGTPPVTLTSSGTAPYVWTVLTGGGVLTGNGTQTVGASSTTDTSVIVCTSTSVCGTATDTFTLFVPPATTLPGDTVFNCGLGAVTTITAAGTAPYTWTVLSGPAVINGSGSSVTVTSTGTSWIIAGSSATCGPVFDTILLKVPTAIVDAGPDNTIYGCGTYAGSLAGSVSGTEPGVVYSYAWTPAGTITGGANTLNPTIVPTTGVTYTLTVTTPANEGGCTWMDSVHIDVSDATVTADFDTIIGLGCTGDTVQFLPIVTNATTYLWDFGNGFTSNLQAPVYVYPQQGTYTVTFTASNPYCSATVSKQITFNHPLQAAYTVTKDSICNGETITFTDASIGSNLTYEWNFGDGSATDNTQNPSHTYTTDGIYNVMLTVRDDIPCISIFEQKIVVASISVNIVPTDTSVCLSDSMMLYAVVTAPPYFSGFTYAWTPTSQIGDPTAQNVNFYMETSGDYNYTVTATGWPMGCVATATNHIFVEPRPVLINVTPDQVVEYGTKVQLNADGVRYYVWSHPATLDNPDISNPVASPVDKSTQYRVIGMNEHGGCRDTAYVNIDLTYTDDFVPTVFSPNGDGKNDLFRIRGIKYQKVIEFRVFNRWGNELFSTQDGMQGWDGRYKGAPQDPGVYGYLIRVSLPDGTTRSYQGNVTLIR
jgi:gliding motility-associated-like protein